MLAASEANRCNVENELHFPCVEEGKKGGLAVSKVNRPGMENAETEVDIPSMEDGVKEVLTVDEANSPKCRTK